MGSAFFRCCGNSLYLYKAQPFFVVVGILFTYTRLSHFLLLCEFSSLIGSEYFVVVGILFTYMLSICLLLWESSLLIQGSAFFCCCGNSLSNNSTIVNSCHYYANIIFSLNDIMLHLHASHHVYFTYFIPYSHILQLTCSDQLLHNNPSWLLLNN